MEACVCGRHYVPPNYSGRGPRPRCRACKRPLKHYDEKGMRL